MQLNLAYEVENLIAPLPFEWLEVWCKVVGVSFDDYLAVYWDSQEAYFQKLEREAEEKAARERGDTPNAPASAPETEAPETNAPALSNRAFGVLSPLRAALEHTTSFFHSLLSML